MRFARLMIVAGLLLGWMMTPAQAALGPQVTWNGTQIHLYDALHAGYDGRGITVAVLDGWIDASHPDFSGRVLQGADCTTGACHPGEGTDDGCGSEHGTHVAGTVGSTSYGVAPAAKILPVRVLTRDPSSGDCVGSPQNVAAGIHWAVQNHAKVLNLSLGADQPNSMHSTAIPDAVSYAANNGVVVVFSAGNADLPVADSYGTNAIVVAATGPSGQLATYSQHGSGVSVAAPGGQPDSSNKCSQASCIVSLYPGAKYAIAAGTSMAAPAVSGIAALLLQQGHDWQYVMDRIQSTAHPLAGAGSGLVDAAAALGVPVHRVVVAPKTTHRVTPPTHVNSAPPKHAVVKAVVKPSPISRPSPSPTPSPTPFASPTAAPVAAAPTANDDSIPTPVAALAGVLVGLAACGVVIVPKVVS